MQEFSNIIWVGCVAHAIDLLLKDVSMHEFVVDILSEVKKVRWIAIHVICYYVAVFSSCGMCSN